MLLLSGNRLSCKLPFSLKFWLIIIFDWLASLATMRCAVTMHHAVYKLNKLNRLTKTSSFEMFLMRNAKKYVANYDWPHMILLMARSSYWSGHENVFHCQEYMENNCCNVATVVDQTKLNMKWMKKALASAFLLSTAVHAAWMIDISTCYFI